MHQGMPQGAAQTGDRATERLRADAAGIDRAATLLRAGRLVAFGTETVYGLGADAGNPSAVAAIFAAKGRPTNNPLIAHFADADAAFATVVPNDAAQRLAQAFWPGPLTLVLPRRTGAAISAIATAGLETLAVRVPVSGAARALLRAANCSVAAPSANRSGSVSPTSAEHVLDGLAGRIDAVLDSGACAVGVESTILDLSGGTPRLLRPGGVTREQIEAVIGPIQAIEEVSRTPISPGQFASHYAPSLPVRLNVTQPRSDEALLAFGTAPDGAGLQFQLSEAGDLAEAAARLFGGLRALDRDGKHLGLSGIAVMPIPSGGVGAAIRDRLNRAAAPRPADTVSGAQR